ncbi:LpqB family beta-propeller domain-containing protein [Kitasatospora terrestris]|uniref:Lipoprotein LpqB beta-propeller domain-containing protein n=1 Tax=Kitasatospora terrestris TaxID=258051 RepID=A0ABP9DPE5_9ACTN
MARSTARTRRRTGGGTASRLGGLAAVGLLATGCVTMPSGGPPERVEPQGAAADDLQVHVYPVAPHTGELPQDLLAGFLDSSNADQANYDTARQYLTADASRGWRPEARVVVLDKPQYGGDAVPEQGDTTAEVSVSGSRVAELDAKHTYQPARGEAFQQTFGFVKETEGPNKGEWRINRLPDGLILDRTNFDNGYKAVHRYFFAVADPSADRPVQVLVPDPIYLRRRIDPLTAAAQATAAGPSDWLAPAVYSALGGVQVRSVTVGDNKVATVKVDGADLTGRPQSCQQMAEQLFQAVADQQGKGQLERLEVTGAAGGCSVGSGQVTQVAPGALAGGQAGSQAYYQLETGQLMRYQDGGQGSPVPGVLGQPAAAGQGRYQSVAVSRDGGAAAVVGAGGKSLYLTGLGEADKLGDSVVSSGAPRADSGLASPSWDGRRDLWIVDRDPAAPRVLMVRGRSHSTVQVEGLGGRTVQALRISSDGTRVALVLKSATGAQSLELGLVVHGGTPGSPQARIVGLRPIAPQLAEVASVAWADSDQLLVLGKEVDKLQQLHYLGTDGSASTDSPQQGGESMTSASATEVRNSTDPVQALPAVLTVSDQGIYRLKDNQWSEVPVKSRAVSFSYPS